MRGGRYGRGRGSGCSAGSASAGAVAPAVAPVLTALGPVLVEVINGLGQAVPGALPDLRDVPAARAAAVSSLAPRCRRSLLRLPSWPGPAGPGRPRSPPRRVTLFAQLLEPIGAGRRSGRSSRSPNCRPGGRTRTAASCGSRALACGWEHRSAARCLGDCAAPVASHGVRRTRSSPGGLGTAPWTPTRRASRRFRSRRRPGASRSGDGDPWRYRWTRHDRSFGPPAPNPR